MEKSISDRSRGLADAAVAITRAATLSDVLTIVTQQALHLIGAHQARTALADGPEEAAPISHVEHSDGYARACDRVSSKEVMVAPLVGASGETIGWIQLEDKIEGEFDEVDEALLVQFAQMAAGAVENARLRRALEESNRRERERTQELEALMEAVPAVVWIAHDREATNITGSRASYETLRLPYGGNVSLSAEKGVAPVNFIVRKNGRTLNLDELPVQYAAMTGNSIQGFEEEVVFDDGVVRHLFGNAAPLHNTDGEIRGAIAAFVDVTNLKEAEGAIRESERRQRVLVEVIDAIRGLDDPMAIAREVCRVTAEALQVVRCGFATVDSDGQECEVVDFARGVPSLAGRHRVEQFGHAILSSLASGQSIAITDTTLDERTRDRFDSYYAPAGLRSVAAIPLIRDGALLALLGADSNVPREWSPEEIALLEDVANRVWDAIERARAQQEIKRATDRYRALAEAAASVVFAADATGTINRFPFLRGVDPEIALGGSGTGWAEVIHPEDRDGAIGVWQRAVATGRAYETEFRIRMNTGEYRWHMVRGVRIRGQHGANDEWIGACVDVHERVTNERTLRLVNELTALTRGATTPEEVIVYAQQLLGENLLVTRCAYGEPANGGRRFLMPPNFCVDCEDLSGRFPISGYSSPTSEALRSGQPLIINDVAQQMTVEGGRDAYLAAAIAAVIVMPVMKDGRLVALLGVHQNRPRTWSSDEVELVQSVAVRTWSELERVRAEHAVQRSEQRIRRTLEAATVGVVLNNSHGQFIYANQPFLKLLSYTEDDLEAGIIDWNLIQAPDRRVQDDQALAQLLESGSCDPYETEYVARDGRRIPVYVGAALVPDSEGSGLLGAAFVTDLTELKRAQDELVRLNADLERRVRDRTAELEAATREMEGFTYTVAHDLRAPLRAIIATSHILEEEASEILSPENRDLLARQATNASHLARLLDDLLVYARISRQDVRRQTVDVSDVAKRVADAVIENHSNSIAIAPGLSASADPDLLRLVLQNLLENAVKFSPSGTPIAFGHDEEGFFVRDQGVGFDMAHAHKLFQPFERLVRQDEFPGTGIGLANVKRVVERHGGRIWVRSVPSKGTTFWFTLAPGAGSNV